MQTSLRRYLPAVLCPLVLGLCWFASRPFAEMGISDDWSYIRTAQVLAQTGHLVYNGWATAMLGWLVYLGALFVKLFGFSFTGVRLSMLPVDLAGAFLLQRTFVRAGIRDWNAALATATLVLSPLFLSLAVIFMTDVPGLLVIVLCLYACLRAVQSATPRATIAWLCFAALSNALGGTVRQIAWLGVLVMVPSTLWLVRRRARVLPVCIPVLLAGDALVYSFMHWMGRQPYSIPESLLPGRFGYLQFRHLVAGSIAAAADLPLFLLPILLLFVFALRRRGSRRHWKAFAGSFLALLLLTAIVARSNLSPGLEPALHSLNPQGLIEYIAVRIVLSVLVFLGVFGLLATVVSPDSANPLPPPPLERKASISWPDLCVVILPFSAAYIGLLMPRAAFDVVFDRYLLALILVALIFIVRFYQEWVGPRLPAAALVLISCMATCSVTATHDLFSDYRARVAAIQQLRSVGVPPTAIDGSFEYDAWTQVEQTGALNDPRVRTRWVHIRGRLLIHPWIVATRRGTFISPASLRGMA